MKMPSMQFYPADWRKDPGVQALGFFERGVWFEIICLMHESTERGVLLLNGKPMPNDALARVLGLDNQILADTLSKLFDYGVVSKRETDNAFFNRRMVRDEQLCQIRREAGKLGGNPVLLKQKKTTGVKQKKTPSTSSSISTSTSEEKDNNNLFTDVPSEFIKSWYEFNKYYTDENFKRVRKMEQQITPKQLYKLTQKFSIPDIETTLQSMENYKKLKDYSSVYLTLNTWLSRSYSKTA